MGFIKRYLKEYGPGFQPLGPGEAFIGSTEPTVQAQTAIGTTYLQTAHALYSFAVDGGAVSTITPVKTAKLPINAVMKGGIVRVTTACTSGGSATVAIGTSAGSSTTSILTATAVASLGVGQTATALSSSASVVLTAAGSITVTIAVAALTAGVIEVWVDYVVASA